MSGNDFIAVFHDVIEEDGYAEQPGHILKEGERFGTFLKWRENNKYFGKYFSILGDSISTLEGYNPKGYNLFYTSDVSEKTGVCEMKDTWWGKVIDYFGGKLLANNSWSGSRVTKLPDRDMLFPSGCSEERTGGLHINGTLPDVVIIYLGFNDWAGGVSIGSEGIEAEDNSFFSVAYRNMLNGIKNNYPDAEIFCCTLNETFMLSDPSFCFPYYYGGTHIEKYNAVIRYAAKEAGCGLIDLYDDHIPYDAVDGSHPTAAGMNTLAVLILRWMCDGEGAAFLDCEGEHDFIIAEEYTGGRREVCKKCGLSRYSMLLLGGDANAGASDRPLPQSHPRAQTLTVPYRTEYERFWNIFGGIWMTSSAENPYGHSGRDELFPLQIGRTYLLDFDTRIRVDKIAEDGCTITVCPNKPVSFGKNLLWRLQRKKGAGNTDVRLLFPGKGMESRYPETIQVKWARDTRLIPARAVPGKICTLSIRIKPMTDFSTKGEIVEFTISDGDLPIAHYAYSAGTLKGYNRINGSRDGGMPFAEGFFDDVTVVLEQRQKDAIQKMLCGIPFAEWKTDYKIAERFGCPGFCVNSSFSCRFEDGGEFVFYPAGEKPEEFVRLMQLLKSICPLPKYSESGKIQGDSNADPDLVDLKSGETIPFYDEKLVLRLYDESTGKEMSIKGTKFFAGRSNECELWLPEPYISRKHAVFSWQDSNWLLQDNNTVNGTWLNGIRLVPGKKYVLHVDDEISFALQKKLIFCKSSIEKANIENLEKRSAALFKAALRTYYNSGYKEKTALKIAVSALISVPLYVPAAIDTTAVTVEGRNYVPLFTSVEEMNAEISVLVIKKPPQEYLPELLDEGYDAIIDPYSKNEFILEQKLMRESLLPFVQAKMSDGEKTVADRNPYDKWEGKKLQGRYCMKKLLGQGGTSEVWLAEESNLGNRPVVVKVYQKSAGSDVFRIGVLQEAYLTGQFDHPAIPKIFDIVETEKFLFIIREYIDGITLSQKLKTNGAFSERTAVSIGLRLADVLHYIHTFSPPYVYRDMKPANVMLTESGEIKLIDFGITTPYRPMFKLDMDHIGTKGYAPPEQYGGQGAIDPRADIYALGVTIYQMLTGIAPNEPPYEKPPIRQVCPNISDGMEYIVNKCIAANRMERYQSCVELMNDLNNLQDLSS